MKSVPYLQLDCIKTDVQLMRLLPSDIARRYHALPVATAGGKITIAMAYPEDTTASDAVASVIGLPVCFVKANLKEIEQRLDEIWPQAPSHRPRLLLWSPISGSEAKLLSYSHSLANQLDTDLEQVDISVHDSQSFTNLILAVERIRPDLVIFQTLTKPLLGIFLSNFASSRTTEQTPTSLLIAQNPRWPLATILIVFPENGTVDNLAINWTIQLARASQTAVSVLPLLSTSSSLKTVANHRSVQTLLKTKDPLGQKIRHIAQRFSEDGIKGSFKLREGGPQDQIRSEILASNPNLVIIAADQQSNFWQCVSADQFFTLFDSIKCPVLISR